MSPALTLQARLTALVGSLRIDVELNTAGGTLVIVGPNGAGKSSVLDLVLGARTVQRGRVSIGDDVLLDTEKAIDVPVEHRRIGYVPQDYALFPHLNVRENLDFAVASTRGQAARASRSQRVDEILHELRLETLAGRRTQTLSGGEKQRVALARALSVNPRALLLDEPLAALDVHSRNEVRGFLADYLDRIALPTVVVTHDAADARALSNTVAVLEAGRITQTGTWNDLTRRPASRFVEQLVAPAGG